MSPTAKWAPLVFDAWTPLSYKKVLNDVHASGIPWLAPVWAGEHTRRWQSYTVLRAYYDNSARLLKTVLTTEEIQAIEGRREYGDAALLVDTARSKCLGDDQQIVVAGADQFDESKGDENTPESRAAAQRQDELRQLADDDRFWTKLVETERNASKLGDGTYFTYWDSRRNRPTTITYEPDAYFPVLETEVDGYPTRVHIAWELTEKEAKDKHGTSKTIIHRITFDLRDVDEYSTPWGPQTQRCFMTEAEFVVGSDVRDVDDLAESAAVYMLDINGDEIRDKDLGIDFIPVIHIPNTIAENDHYGQSTIARQTQLLDDLASVDSDIQASGDLTGNPTLVTKGAPKVDPKTGAPVNINVGPGLHLDVPTDGDAFFLSGHEGIDGLMRVRAELLDRLSVNSRITAAAQGRIDVTKLQAGVILQLSFGPLSSLIDEMRLARRDKYRLKFKFDQKFMLLNGVWDGELLVADLLFGSYLPSDRTAVINDCINAVKAGVMSLETAIRMMIEVGVPVEDIADEIAKIDARDYAGAVQLLDATGSDKAVGDKLGVEIERPDPEAIPEVPPVDPDDPENQPPQAQ